MYASPIRLPIPPAMTATCATVIDNQVRLRSAFLASKRGLRKKRRVVGDPKVITPSANSPLHRVPTDLPRRPACSFPRWRQPAVHGSRWPHRRVRSRRPCAVPTQTHLTSNGRLHRHGKRPRTNSFHQEHSRRVK